MNSVTKRRSTRESKGVEHNQNKSPSKMGSPPGQRRMVTFEVVPRIHLIGTYYKDLVRDNGPLWHDTDWSRPVHMWGPWEYPSLNGPGVPDTHSLPCKESVPRDPTGVFPLLLSCPSCYLQIRSNRSMKTQCPKSEVDQTCGEGTPK